MCKYCGTNKHRKIYENHIGPIPKDSFGRTFDIHHLDGNHANNDPENLKAVSIQEHYDIHYMQKDYGACIALAKRMKISPADRAELARNQQLKRAAEGTHHFLGGELQRINSIKQIEEGTHNFTSELQHRRVAEGTHPFSGGELQRRTQQRMLSEGTHPLKGKTGLGHPKSDKKVYKLRNLITGKVCVGTRGELKKASELSDDAISKLVRGKTKTWLNWELC